MKILINENSVEVIKDYRLVLMIPTATKQFSDRTVQGLLVIMGSDVTVVDLRK